MDDATLRASARAPERSGNPADRPGDAAERPGDAADRPGDAADRPEHAAVTGVAKGSLGTATALEETQEWVIAELQAPPEPQPEPHSRPRAAPVPDADGSAAPQPQFATIAAAPAVQPARPSRPMDRSPSPRTAGIAVALLIGAVAVVGLLSSLGSFEAPGGLPPGADQATAAPAPTEDPDADDDGADDGGDGGGGGGGGNGGGNGNGGGRGNGNGGGNGGGGGRGND